MNHQSKRLWVLGAPDPEMDRIARLLAECGEPVTYATMSDGSRVRPEQAYRCPVPTVPTGTTVYAVECFDVLPDGWVRIDHHRPGDPGYGRPPSEFLPASSIGQVIAELARTDRVPREWELGNGYGDDDRPIGGIGLQCQARRNKDGSYIYAAGHRVMDDIWTVRLATDWADTRVARVATIPTDIIFAAAADHCLAAAYRGECPGVEPDALMCWRVKSCAAFQRRTVENVLADVERAREALRRADPISLTARPDCTRCNGSGMYYDAHGDDSASGQPTADGYALCACGGFDPQWAADLRGQHVPELPEASAREGICFVADGILGQDGRIKVVCQSGSPEQIAAFIERWAPAQGLTDIYGDPARGFAGGYLAAQAAFDAATESLRDGGFVAS